MVELSAIAPSSGLFFEKEHFSRWHTGTNWQGIAISQPVTFCQYIYCIRWKRWWL
ncbi:MAG TPA: hypothetical protein VK211_03645 [Kamptonema sp.]|nr:hypothetical protein [Kamptonema sp.]